MTKMENRTFLLKKLNKTKTKTNNKKIKTLEERDYIEHFCYVGL